MNNLEEKLKDVNKKIEGLISYYNAEFDGGVKAGKLILKVTNCGKKGCKYCPHGPYWYRAVFNQKSKKYIFQYLKSRISKGMLSSQEKRDWDRIKFYDNEAYRLREMKKQISKAISMNNKLLMGSSKAKN